MIQDTEQQDTGIRDGLLGSGKSQLSLHVRRNDRH